MPTYSHTHAYTHMHTHTHAHSRSSVADDGIEAHKLSSPNTDKAKLLSLAGLLPEDPAEIEGESLSQLRESVKTEKEQKV